MKRIDIDQDAVPDDVLLISGSGDRAPHGPPCNGRDFNRSRPLVLGVIDSSPHRLVWELLIALTGISSVEKQYARAFGNRSPFPVFSSE